MGWAFKVPRHDDIKQWRKVEVLRRAGITFERNRGYPPFETLRDAEAYLEARRLRRQKTNLQRADDAKRELRRRRVRSRQRARERRLRAQRAKQAALLAE